MTNTPTPRRNGLLPAGMCWLLFFYCLMGRLAAQQPPAPDTSAETTQKDEPATFKSRVNLVMVPVVVRDGQGHAVGNLRKEDFRLLDKGKPQVISSFSVEKPGTPVVVHLEPLEPEAAETPGATPTPAPTIPTRFTAYLFDDVHVSFADLMRSRDAAGRHLASSLQPTDRVAIFTTSGRVTLDFTDDRAQLQQTLLRIRPTPIARSSVRECPDVTYYQADMLVNRNDPLALSVAMDEASTCMPQGVRPDPAVLRNMAMSAAQHALMVGDTETHQALAAVTDVVRRISIMPGARSIVLVSPGFYTPMSHERGTIMDRAIRSNVVISSLDARGLYVIIPGGDASQQSQRTISASIHKADWDRATAQEQANVLGELADGTGGSFYHNSNDLDEGFKRIAAAPDYLYVLGFSPQNLKMDGHYHTLKVVLANPSKLSLKARRGYYAPTSLASAEEQAKREIEEAIFSREEMQELPARMNTQFFKSSDTSAKLTVVVHIEVKQMSFRLADGRHQNDLTLAYGLFDRNGNYILGQQKRVIMKLRDLTLQRMTASGLTVKTGFDVKPGGYAIRLVLRDSEGHQMTALNGAVEIP
jgi:VWFA-related protein